MGNEAYFPMQNWLKIMSRRSSVVVLPIHSPLMVAHQWACLDYVSNGRAILGVGLGRDHHYRQFEVSPEG